MATATVSGGGHHHHHHWVALSASEIAAANSALANLSITPSAKAGSSALLSGSGTDTFAGGVAGATRYLPSFSSDTVTGGTTSSAVKSVALSATPLSLAGPTVAGIKTVDPTVATAGHVITLHDQTTINLIGVSGHSIPKA